MNDIQSIFAVIGGMVVAFAIIGHLAYFWLMWGCVSRTEELVEDMAKAWNERYKQDKKEGK